jgi:2-succinyl-5-enolpyruvyl-6-hydroxy-3-cyclohexene-1-carboxylate synthase
MTPNATLAGAVLGRLAGLGVREYVVCAGARNVPLVGSLLERCQDLNLRNWHHFDERAAAFFALGLGRGKGEPVAVLTTSGTAVAELLPAAIEAYYSGIPLVFVTADRPVAFRGSGAPQAIEQAGIFGPYAMALDLEAAEGLDSLAAWTRDAPLHLNVCFDEPRAKDRHVSWGPDASTAVPAAEPANVPSERPYEARLGSIAASATTFCQDRAGLLVLLGELPSSWRDAVTRLLVSLGAPVWAEATSGLRECPALADLLHHGEPALPQKVLRIGGVPSLRLWRDLENNDDLPVLSICARPFSGLARTSQLLVTSDFPDLVLLAPERPCPESPPCNGGTFDRFPRSEPALVRDLSRWIPPHALVYLGNSLPVREWNSFASVDPPHPNCHASRGANGIDGQVATFLGLSNEVEESWGLFGDLTVLYDLNAPALLTQLAPGKRRIVVINNGGGRIFSRLPSMAGMSPGEKQVTENRHRIGFEAWASMWGMEYRLWRAGEAFPEDLPDTVLIEAIPDEAETEAFWEHRK